MIPRNCNDPLRKAEGNPLIVHFQLTDANQAPMVLIEVVMIQEPSLERQVVLQIQLSRRPLLPLARVRNASTGGIPKYEFTNLIVSHDRQTDTIF
jgi:hypothetical protein